MKRRGILGVLAAIATAGCNEIRKAIVGPALDQTVYESFAHEDGALVIRLSEDPTMNGQPPAVFSVEGPFASRYRWRHDGTTTYRVTGSDLGSEFVNGDYTVTAAANSDGSGETHEVVVSLSSADSGYTAKVTEVTIVEG